MNFQNTPIDYKQEAIKQWTETPIGVSYTSYAMGTDGFFKDVERHRYEVYAPWMKEIFTFHQFQGKQLLEIGVGVGTDHLQFARGGAILSGVDITPKSIELTRASLARYGFHSDLRVADAEHLPFSNNTFDVVYSFGVLHHTPDTQRAIDEVYRVLKPGGRAMIALYHRNSLMYRFTICIYERIFRFRFLKESLRQQLSRVEYSRSDAKPLVQLFTISEFRTMCAKFFKVQLFVRHFDLSQLPIPHRFGIYRIIERLVPSAIVRWIDRRFGWYVIVKAYK